MKVTPLSGLIFTTALLVLGCSEQLDRQQAINIAEEATFEYLEDQCPNETEIVGSSVFFKGQDRIDVQVKILNNDGTYGLVSVFVYKSIKLGLMKIDNPDIVGLKNICRS